MFVCAELAMSIPPLFPVYRGAADLQEAAEIPCTKGNGLAVQQKDGIMRAKECA
jgi:hypothetical protein